MYFLKIRNKAHAVFQEALKYDYENWKIWENFLWVSVKKEIFFRIYLMKRFV